MIFRLPPPDQQISFAYALEQMRGLFLMDALQECVEQLDLSLLDSELHLYGEGEGLRRLAAQGLRGELAFATPCVLRRQPGLLGYYRLLLGYSQKAFYTRETGFSKFASMEKKGEYTPRLPDPLPGLCTCLNQSAALLIRGLPDNLLRREFLDDLTLLTLGPQMRGGANVQRGTDAILDVFAIIRDIIAEHLDKMTDHRMELTNASGRRVLIEFCADPDIVVRQMTAEGDFLNRIAIEVKGGQDFSNIHNRIGEAEKSHQKARAMGYVECWTVVNVDAINMETAKQESPTTDKFFRISDLLNPGSIPFREFRNGLIVNLGI